MRSRRRTVLLIAGTAVGSLLVGLIAADQLQSPADRARAAQAPNASEITVPVERRELKNDIVTRGDSSFAGSVEVELEADTSTPPVVTGHVPEVGDELNEGEPLLEIVGRPVIALVGELPMYRSLQPGMSGPDVEQLKETLQRLGYHPGTPADRYTGATSDAVAQMFRDAGYDPPEPDQQAVDALAAAEDTLDGARAALATAKQELADFADLEEVDDRALAAAEGAVDNARKGVSTAEQERDTAAAAVGTPLPLAELVYLPELPSRVDDVRISRGDLVEGPVMSISAADLVITIMVDESDRQLLEEDMTATVQLPDGDEVTAEITTIEPVGDGDGYAVIITPDDLAPEQVEQLREANVLVTIPVASTGGEVLAVPLAALTAGPGGESRVEMMSSNGEVQLVEVEVGLSADGYAEITPVGGALAEGDLVVVGQTAAADLADPE